MRKNTVDKDLEQQGVSGRGRKISQLTRTAFSAPVVLCKNGTLATRAEQGPRDTKRGVCREKENQFAKQKKKNNKPEAKNRRV